MLTVDNTSHLKHAARCSERHSVVVLVIAIDNLNDSCLNNHFGAFIAGEHSCVNDTPFYFGTVFVKDCILFSMAHVWVFGVKGVFSLACPGKIVV